MTRDIFTSVYSGTKEFVVAFSESMQKELGSEFDVLCVTLGPVKTKLLAMHDVPGALTVEQHVRSSLARLGYESLSCGHYKHELLKFMFTAPLISIGPKMMLQRELRKLHAEHSAASTSSS